MNSRLTMRLADLADAPSLAQLEHASPDGGSIGFSFDYQANLLSISRALASGNLLAAAASIDEQIVGMLFGDLYPVQWAGNITPGVYISNLRVHPAFRRQGIARSLAQWGEAYLEEIFASQAVCFGAVMRNNTSLNLAKQFGFLPTASVQGGTVPMRKTAPYPIPGLTIRLASSEDLPAIAEGMNHFYQGYDLWNPVDAAKLKSFIKQQVSGIFPNQLYVVTRGECILGGLSISDRTHLVRMHIQRASAMIRLLGAILGILPRSGLLRALTLRRMWFYPGELPAARYLWQSLRYTLRLSCDCLGIAYDPRSPLSEVFQIPIWLPMFPASYLVRAALPPNPERLIYCVAGP